MTTAYEPILFKTIDFDFEIEDTPSTKGIFLFFFINIEFNAHLLMFFKHRNGTRRDTMDK